MPISTRSATSNRDQATMPPVTLAASMRRAASIWITRRELLPRAQMTRNARPPRSPRATAESAWNVENGAFTSGTVPVSMCHASNSAASRTSSTRPPAPVRSSCSSAAGATSPARAAPAAGLSVALMHGR